MDEQATGSVGALRQIPRLAERQRDRLRTLAQRQLERLLVERSAGVVDDERLVRQPAHAPDLFDDLGGREQRRADAPDPAGFGHRRRQRDRAPRADRRLDHGMLDTEQLAQRRSHVGSLTSGTAECRCAETAR